MLWILGTNNIHVATLFAAHALAPFTQFLDRAADFHAARLAEAQAIEARGEIANVAGGQRGACEKAGAQAIAAGRVDVHALRGGALGEERGARGERAAQGDGEGSREHLFWGGRAE